MTPKPTEQEAADQREYDSRLAEKQAKVQALLHGDAPAQFKIDHEYERDRAIDAQIANMSKPTRAPRKDKGVPRAKPAPAPAPEQGKLSSTQAARLLDLIASAESRRVEWDAAQAHASEVQERMHDADAELLAFIRENTQS